MKPPHRPVLSRLLLRFVVPALAYGLACACASAQNTTSPANGSAPAPARLFFAAGPLGGAALSLDSVKDLVEEDNQNTSSTHAPKIDPAALSVKAPLPVYFLSADDIARNLGLSAARDTGRFYYLVEAPGPQAWAVQVEVDKTGAPAMDSVNQGLFSEAAWIAHEKLPALIAAYSGAYEVRLVDGGFSSLSFLWLKSDSGAADLIYPITFNAPWMRGKIDSKLYPAADFFAAYQPIVLEDVPPFTPAAGGPPSTANITAAPALPPAVFTSNVTVLGPATGLMDDLGDFHTCAVSISSQGCRIAWAGTVGQQAHMFLDGVPGPAFDEVSRPTFSADGRHLAYLAKAKGVTLQIVDGQRIELGGYSDDFAFSPDARHTSYSILDDHTYIDGKMDLHDGYYFTPDSQIVYLTTGKDGLSHLLRHGQTGQGYKDIDNVTFSPDGRRMAMKVSGDAADKLRRVVVDDVPGPAYPYIGDIRFSADGRHVAYVAGSEGPQAVGYLVLDGKPLFPLADPGYFGLESEYGDPFIFSPDGTRLATLVESAHKFHLRVDGQDGPAVDAPSYEDSQINLDDPGRDVPNHSLLFQFSPDSRHIAQFAKSGDQWRMLLDGVPGPAFTGYLHYLTFSPDSRHTAYVAEYGRQFRGDSERVFHHQNWQLIVDQVPGPLFDDIAPALLFSPDSRQLAYPALKDGQWRVYINGTPGPPFAAIIAGPVLCQDGRLEYLATQKSADADQLVRVVVPDFGHPSVTAVSK
jgi:hypothetical protein